MYTSFPHADTLIKCSGESLMVKLKVNLSEPASEIKIKYYKLYKEKDIMEIECMDIYVMVTNFSGLEILLNQFFQLSLQPLSGK